MGTQGYYGLPIYWPPFQFSVCFPFMIIPVAMISAITYIIFLNLHLTSSWALIIFSALNNKATYSSICPTVISIPDGFSFPSNHLLPAYLQWGHQYFELNTWLESGTHHFHSLPAPCWSPEPSSSTTEIATEHPTSYHCLVFGRFTHCIFSGLLQWLPFWSFCPRLPWLQSSFWYPIR